MGSEDTITNKYLYVFWKEVPTIQYVDPDVYELINQDVRSTILEIMRKGETTEYSKLHDLPSKRAFSAQELLQYVNEEISSQVKLSNIYFHLDKLEAEELIKPVGVIKEGNHKTKYFGRTAKVFIFQSETIKDKEVSKLVGPLLDLILELHPEKSESELEDIFEYSLEYNKEIQKKYADWVIKHQDIIIDLDLDFLSLFDFFSDIYKATDTKYRGISETIRHLLDLPEDGSL